MRMFTLLIFILTPFCLQAEVTEPGPLRITIQADPPPGATGIPERYPPRTPQCSTDVNVAEDRANENWNALSNVQKARYLMDTYKLLLERHGYDYSYRILTCKSYRETGFDYMLETGAAGSTAAGLSQVTQETAIDLFARTSFRSRLGGFEDYSGQQIYNALCESMLLQMEIGLGVMHMKSRDNNGTENAMHIMAAYHGHRTQHCCNELFGRAIYACADCILKNGDQPTQACLDKAKYSFIREPKKDENGNPIPEKDGDGRDLPLESYNCALFSPLRDKWACYPEGLRGI